MKIIYFLLDKVIQLCYNINMIETNNKANNQEGNKMTNNKEIMQNLGNQVCKTYAVPNIPIFTNTQRPKKGIGCYITTGKQPIRIIVFNFRGINPDFAEILAHELAHHIMFVNNNSLRHSKKFTILWETLTEILDEKVYQITGGQ